MVGRLPRGASIEQVASRAEVIASRLQTAYPDTNRNRRFMLTPLGEGRGLRVATRPILRQLAGAVLMVLMVACANVASLLLVAGGVAREGGRRAGRHRRQPGTTCSSVAHRIRAARASAARSRHSSSFGLTTPLLHTFVLPEAVDLSVNARVLGFTLVVGVGSGLLFGLAPAFQVRRRDTVTSLRAEGGTVATGARAARMRGAFVVLQVAVSLVLLVGAGLFLRTLNNAYSVDLGIPHRSRPGRFSQSPGARLLRRRAAGGRCRIGGVRTDSLQGRSAPGRGRCQRRADDGPQRRCPLDGGQHGWSPHREGQQQCAGRPRECRQPSLLRDDAHPDPPWAPVQCVRWAQHRRVTVVTKSLADRLWPNEEPIGKTLRDERQQLQVVGVVPDTVYTSTMEHERPPTYLLAAGAEL